VFVWCQAVIFFHFYWLFCHSTMSHIPRDLAGTLLLYAMLCVDGRTVIANHVAVALLCASLGDYVVPIHTVFGLCETSSWYPWVMLVVMGVNIAWAFLILLAATGVISRHVVDLVCWRCPITGVGIPDRLAAKRVPALL
jgi:hypothetical protein